MRSTTVLGLAATALAAPSLIQRDDTCSKSYDGQFEITVKKVEFAKRDLEARAQCAAGEGALVITLEDGILRDSQKRQGNVVSNYQFQFDPQPQPGAKETDQFGVCSNGTLSHSGSSQWYQCQSGNFVNLYTKSWAAQCEPVQIFVMPCGASSGGSVGEAGDGQATQRPDGQVNQPTGVPVTQISDGQVQAPSSIPVATQIADGQVQAPTSAPIGAPVTQIGDGQVQAPTSAPTGAPVTQIGDGQVQAPTSAPTGAPVSQIGDGQVQAPTSAPTGAPVTQIGDGQVQAPTSVGTVSAPATTAPTMLPAAAAGHIVPSIALVVAALGAIVAF